MRYISYNKSGFTLVEMSMILIIIALIVASILTSSDLIHQAKIRSQIIQLTKYEKAYNIFYLKYDAVPGDFSNATDYWSTNTSDGDGDGLLESTSCTPAGCYLFNAERDDFFEQLSLAELTGYFDNSTDVGKGYPELKLKRNSGMVAIDSGIVGAGHNSASTSQYRPDDLYQYSYKPRSIYLAMIIADPTKLNVDETFDDSGIFFPGDLYNVDKKIDDGLPLAGRFLGFGYNSSGANCLSAAPYSVATEYNYSYKVQHVCLAMYRIDE